MYLDNSEDYPPFPDDYSEAYKLIKKYLKFNEQYRSSGASLNNSRLTQIYQQRVLQKTKNESFIYQLNSLEDNSSVKLQDQQQMNQNNEDCSIKKTIKLKNKLNEQQSISVDKTYLKNNNNSDQVKNFDDELNQSESEIYQKDNLKSKIDILKKTSKDYNSDSYHLEQNEKNHQTQDRKENFEFNSKLNNMTIQFTKQIVTFSHKVKELLQKKVIQSDSEIKNTDAPSQNQKQMLNVTNIIDEKYHKPYFTQNSNQQSLYIKKSARQELQDLQKQQNQIQLKFDKLCSKLNQNLKKQANRCQENQKNNTFSHQILIDQSSQDLNHFDVDLDSQNSLIQIKKIGSYHKRMNFTSKSYNKFVQEFDSCIQIVQIRSKKNVNQYLWKMGNIKLWASLGSAIQKNFQLFMINAKKYQRMFNKYLEYEENKKKQKSEYYYEEDYLSKPKKMTLKRQQKSQKIKHKYKNSLKSEIVLQKHAFNKVLVNKVIQFEKQIADHGKQQVIVQREQDKFSQFLPEADEIQILIEDLINKNPEQQMKNGVKKQKKLKQQLIKREIKRPELSNKRNYMVNKLKQIANNVNYPHQINNLFILSNRESFDKVACYLNKLRSQNQVEIVDRETFYKETSLSKNNRQNQLQKSQQRSFPICIDLTS